jgi:hypothetical protein
MNRWDWINAGKGCGCFSYLFAMGLFIGAAFLCLFITYLVGR